MKLFNSGLVRKRKSGVLACLMALGVYATPILAEDTVDQLQAISKQELIYSYDEMLNFDVEESLQAQEWLQLVSGSYFKNSNITRNH